MNYLYLVSSQPRLQRCFASLISAGCAIALSSCTGGSAPSNQTIAYDNLAEIDVQPIRVCNDNGGQCAGVNMFADITARILEQAQLKVNFLPTNQLNESRFLSLNSSSDRNSDSYEFYELSRSGGPGDYGRHEDSTRTTGPINVWFVDTIESSSSATQFGLAWVDANGVAISSETLEYNDGEGRIDTVAHEIGHNLGLRHSTLGAGGKENLLTDGNTRLTPGSADDVGENGAGISLLTASQIKEIRSSGFVKGNESDADADYAGADELHSHGSHTHDHGDGHVAHDHEHLHTHDSHTHDSYQYDQIASVPFANIKLAQVNEAAGATQRVPEPATGLGLSILGLSMLASKLSSKLSSNKRKG